MAIAGSVGEHFVAVAAEAAKVSQVREVVGAAAAAAISV